jgi:hypothetical protein
MAGEKEINAWSSLFRLWRSVVVVKLCFCFVFPDHRRTVQQEEVGRDPGKLKACRCLAPAPLVAADADARDLLRAPLSLLKEKT